MNIWGWLEPLTITIKERTSINFSLKKKKSFMKHSNFFLTFNYWKSFYKSHRRESGSSTETIHLLLGSVCPGPCSPLQPHFLSCPLTFIITVGSSANSANPFLGSGLWNIHSCPLPSHSHMAMDFLLIKTLSNVNTEESSSTGFHHWFFTLCFP